MSDQSNTNQSRGVNCRDCPYQAIWYTGRTDRDSCKHDMVTDHDVRYVEPEDIRRTVDINGNEILVHEKDPEAPHE